jgi:membrane dipeptidase
MAKVEKAPPGSDGMRALIRGSDVIDLHVDTLIPARIWGYDVLSSNARGLFGGRFFGHLDLPSLENAGVTGAMWSITTNPLRGARGRWITFERNVKLLERLVASSAGRMRMVTDAESYRLARLEGAHGVFLSIQGGNALEEADAEQLAGIGALLRVTLIHMSNSAFGASSSPSHRLRSNKGLTTQGRRMVEKLHRARVFIDLAHAHPKTFWDVVEMHPLTDPLLVTHTGVSGVYPHWRNIDDDQIRAIARTGGVVGIIFAKIFLGPASAGPNGIEAILDHMEHVIRIAGDDHVGIGSDLDGAIIPPIGCRDAGAYPLLVQAMLQRGWSEVRIRKILGGNFLRALDRLRPTRDRET